MVSVIDALEAERPGFGHTVVVEDARPPAGLDALPRRRDAAAGLAGDDEGAHGRSGQVDAFLLGHLGEALERRRVPERRRRR